MVMRMVNLINLATLSHSPLRTLLQRVSTLWCKTPNSMLRTQEVAGLKRKRWVIQAGLSQS